MKVALLASIWATACSAAAVDHQPYLTRLADNFISQGIKPGHDYQRATLYLGIQKAYELNWNSKYLDWLINQISDVVVRPDGSIVGWNPKIYSLDDMRMSHNYLYLYNITGENKYKEAARVSREQLNIFPRTPSGGFWHNGPYFPNQMWLDGIFMGDSFYAKWTHLFDAKNMTAWDDVLLQYTLIDTHTRNTTSNLLVHGWADPAKAAKWADPTTGKAPHVWGRAVGWYFMSLMETLQVFPESHPGYKTLMDFFVRLAEGVQHAQDPATGGWWQVLDEPYPGMKGNYIEASGSAMFTYGLLKGINLGYLDRKRFLCGAKKAYKGLVKQFIEVDDKGVVHYNGTVQECGLATDNPSYEYYISVPTHNDDFKGSGPFMLAAYEWETWAKKHN